MNSEETQNIIQLIHFLLSGEIQSFWWVWIMLQGLAAVFEEQISGCVLNYPAKIVACFQEKQIEMEVNYARQQSTVSNFGNVCISEISWNFFSVKIESMQLREWVFLQELLN